MRFSELASRCGSAIQCGVVLGLVLSCSRPTVSLEAHGIRGSEGQIRHRAPPPSPNETYCAWYGKPQDGIFYYGSAAFWSSYRERDGDARGDLLQIGPRPIGRFELANERHLDPLEVGKTESRSGVWDVFPHPNGRLYFTTLFEEFGSTTKAGDHVRIHHEAGDALNELAPGPAETILATRYWGPGFSSGSVVLLNPEGSIQVEFPLSSTPGIRLAPKTPAFDRVRNLIWLTTDRLEHGPEHQSPNPGPGGKHHPTLAIDLSGHERLRIESFEVHTLGFDRAGTGYFAVVDESELRLHVLATAAAPESLLQDPGILVDAKFPAHVDFVQGLSVDDDGQVLLTRWSGHLHWIDARPGVGRVRNLKLPAYDSGGLYYSSARAGERVCTSYCSDLSVVCTDLADFEGADEDANSRGETRGGEPR